MIDIMRGLQTLFRVASRISARTAHGLFQHGTGTYAVRAVRAINLTIGGRHILYEGLNTFDREVVDEVVQYVTRFAFNYVDHHDENTNYRLSHRDLASAVQSHAAEIMDAAVAALKSRLMSRGYDYFAPPSQRVAIFQDEDLTKQLVLSVINEVIQHIDAH